MLFQRGSSAEAEIENENAEAIKVILEKSDESFDLDAHEDEKDRVEATKPKAKMQVSMAGLLGLGGKKVEDDKGVPEKNVTELDTVDKMIKPEEDKPKPKM